MFLTVTKMRIEKLIKKVSVSLRSSYVSNDDVAMDKRIPKVMFPSPYGVLMFLTVVEIMKVFYKKGFRLLTEFLCF